MGKLTSGKEAEGSEEHETERPWARPSNRPGAGLAAEVGAEYPEHPAEQGACGVMGLQRKLIKFSDAYYAKEMHDKAVSSGDCARAHHVKYLVDPTESHEWLWPHNQNHGTSTAQEYIIIVVRLRLGAARPDEPTHCANCGNAYVGPTMCAPLSTARDGHATGGMPQSGTMYLKSPSRSTESPNSSHPRTIAPRAPPR